MAIMNKKLIFIPFFAACGGTDQDPSTDGPQTIEVPCTPEQGGAYADGIPYQGIHADAGNSDVIACESASAYVESWFSLQGLGLTQPNTFSPDGSVLYVTTANPDPEGCRVHALRSDTGDVLWCKSYSPTVALGSIEVDTAGDLYFTTEGSIHSLNASGDERWTVPVVDAEGIIDQPWGVHFTPDGHVATVTSSGTVYLVAREDGAVLSSLSIPEIYGFVEADGFNLDIDLSAILPQGVLNSIEVLWGPQDSESTAAGISTLLGGGAFCDNTVGVAPNGSIYVIGGGPDVDTGALVQINVSGSSDRPSLEPGWYTPIRGGSATSPSISKGGQFVVISDGTGAETFFDPESVDAWVKVMDIPACDANTDADPDPAVCGVDYQQPLERDPMIGAPAIDEDGVVIFWEQSLSFNEDAQDRDLVAFDSGGVLWEAALPHDMEWASVITVTDNHLIGTASTITESDESLLSLNFPSVTDDYLVLLDRSSGELVWRGELPDDGAATVTIGPDGALYAGVYGLLSMLAVDELPNAGLVRFSPIASE